jgi:hypothetical protein
MLGMVVDPAKSTKESSIRVQNHLVQNGTHMLSPHPAHMYFKAEQMVGFNLI